VLVEFIKTRCCYNIDVDVLDVGVADVDKDPMVLYLGYYDQSLSRWSYMFLSRLLYMACVAYDTCFV